MIEHLLGLAGRVVYRYVCGGVESHLGRLGNTAALSALVGLLGDLFVDIECVLVAEKESWCYGWFTKSAQVSGISQKAQSSIPTTGGETCGVWTLVIENSMAAPAPSDFFFLDFGVSSSALLLFFSDGSPILTVWNREFGYNFSVRNRKVVADGARRVQRATFFCRKIDPLRVHRFQKFRASPHPSPTMTKCKSR